VICDNLALAKPNVIMSDNRFRGRRFKQ